MRPRISIRGSVRPSVRRSVRRSIRRSVRNAFFLNPRKRLFLVAEMDGIELVVTRGDEGAMVTRGMGGGDGGDDGWGRI